MKELSNSFFFKIPESQVKGKEEKGTRDEAMKGAIRKRSKGKNKRVSRREERE